MLLDYEKNVVSEGDYLVEADEDTADFYVIRNGKPEYFARWGCMTQLNLVNPTKTLDNINNMRETNDNEVFVKEYCKKVYNRKQNMNTQEMYLVNNKLKELLIELQEKGKKIVIRKSTHICLFGQC